MLAPHLRKNVDKLWDRFWSAGLTNPLVAVEQITYLLFLKRLEDLDRDRVATGKPSVYERRLPDDAARFDGNTCRWSYIRQQSTDTKHLIEVVFPWLRTLDRRLSDHEEGTELAGLNGRMADAYFQLDPNKGQVLHDAIDLIDKLFAQAGDGSAAQDLMGDTFEYLLSEVATAGKNGQFRTPRHLIRFMVELLAPRPGERLIDPAAGTGGFLFSAQQYLRRQGSTPENVRLEWDGAPHRLDLVQATEQERALIEDGACFVGIDNDRTMARIGWMNLVLHHIHNPRLMQGDSLSKREGKPELAPLLASESYRYVLANPPFTGTVDTADLERDSLLFPRAGTKGKKKEEVLTNKSELLFVWLMLDLLQVGGRCAVIVPEGVLFGNTDAHVKLRRELLTEHCVEAVISLPGGVFQPYTGVKTSILVFRKETPRAAKTSFEKNAPRTDQVWFYEVATDGYSLDAKRTPRPGQDNDLWDALVQFRRWLQEGRAATEGEPAYHQPRYWRERWRQASLRDASGQLTPAGFAFADDPEAAPAFDGKTWAIHELFPELLREGEETIDPQEAEARVRERVAPRLAELASRHFAHADPKTAATEWNRAGRDLYSFFEDEGPALALWKQLTAAAREQVTYVPMAAVDERLAGITAPEVRNYAEVQKGYTPFAEGDVLFAKVTPCMQNGKAAIASDLIGGIGFGSTEFHVLRPDTRLILAEYLLHFVRQRQFREQAKAAFVGTGGLQRVPPDFFKRVKLPLPSLPEQRRIVEALRHVAPQPFRSAIDQAKRLQSALITEALSGRLTAAWREQHAQALAEAARERDARLGAPAPRVTVRITEHAPTERRTDLARPRRQAVIEQLSSFQHEVWNTLRFEWRGAVLADDPAAFEEFCTSPQTAWRLEGFAAGREEVRRALEQLAAMGLIRKMSLPRVNRNTGRTEYLTAFRPLREAEDGSRPEEDTALADAERLGRELERRRAPEAH